MGSVPQETFYLYKTLQVLRIRLTDHFRQAWLSLSHLVLAAFIPLLVAVRYDGRHATIAWLFASGYMLSILLPHAAIHIRYALVSRGATVRVIEEGRLFVLESARGSKTVSKSDIRGIELVIPLALAGRSMFFFPWTNYGYAVFSLQNGERFVLTTLHSERILRPLGFEPSSVVYFPYCWPPKGNLSVV